MDLIVALRAVDFLPVLQYLGAADILALDATTATVHHELAAKPAKFWQRLASASGYPYRLRAGQCGPGPGPYLRATHALRLRFMRHPQRDFTVEPSARFRDLVASALNCIRRRQPGCMFVIRTGPGFARMRPVTDNRVRIVDLAAPGDLIQVLPANAGFLVYDRGPVSSQPRAGTVVEIACAFTDAPPVVLAPPADSMADLFPHIVRYLHSGRLWSILFNDPTFGQPARPVQLICSRKPDRRRAFEMRAVHRTNMVPTFDVIENYLRVKSGERPRPCPDVTLYPGLRPAMDPDDTLTTCNYVHIWWSYGLYWFQMVITPVNRPDWMFPIASFRTLHDLFTQLEQLQLV